MSFPLTQAMNANRMPPTVQVTDSSSKPSRNCRSKGSPTDPTWHSPRLRQPITSGPHSRGSAECSHLKLSLPPSLSSKQKNKKRSQKEGTVSEQNAFFRTATHWQVPARRVAGGTSFERLSRLQGSRFRIESGAFVVGSCLGSVGNHERWRRESVVHMDSTIVLPCNGRMTYVSSGTKVVRQEQ